MAHGLLILLFIYDYTGSGAAESDMRPALKSFGICIAIFVNVD